MGSNSTSCYYNPEIIRRNTNSIIPPVDSPIPLSSLSTAIVNPTVSSSSSSSSSNSSSSNSSSSTPLSIPASPAGPPINLSALSSPPPPSMLHSSLSVSDPPPLSPLSPSPPVSPGSTVSTPFQNQQYTIDLYSNKSYDSPQPVSSSFSSPVTSNLGLHNNKNISNDSWINSYYLPKYGNKFLQDQHESFSPAKHTHVSSSSLDLNLQQSLCTDSLTTSASFGSDSLDHIEDSILSEQDKIATDISTEKKNKEMKKYNTNALIGWQIHVNELGTGCIHSFVDQYEDTLRFLIQLQDGRKFILPILIPTAKNSNDKEINSLPETNLLTRIFSKE